MAKKSFIRQVAGCMAAFSMLTAVCTQAQAFFEVSDGIELLQEGTFEDDDPSPWHVYGAGEADAEMVIENGVCAVKIIENGGKDVGGTSRWDLQLVCGNISLQQGHTYRVQAEITPDCDGEIYTKIGNSAGDNELWRNGYGKYHSMYSAGDKCVGCKAGKKLVFDCTWLCPQDMKSAEWAFQFGGAGDYQENDCFPNGTILQFDNLSITDVSLTKELYGRGDVNLDSRITIADVVLLQRYCNEEETEISPYGLFQADVLPDSEITSEDVTYLLRYIAHYERKLPVQL